MPVLTQSSLEDSPLADLHVLAAELAVDGFRKLRKTDLIDAILDRQPEGGGTAAPEADEESASPRRRRGGRSRSRAPRDRDADTQDDVRAEDDAEPVAAKADAAEAELPDESAGVVGTDDVEERPARTRRRGGRSRSRDAGDPEALDQGARAAESTGPSSEDDRPRRGRRDEDERSEDKPRRGARRDDDEREGDVVTGVVELLGNGSGFLRVNPPEPSDDDVYVSAAQVRRCELVSGDRIAGPVRAPRRSERYPSLVRIDTINDRPADEVAEGTPWDELPCAFPTERLVLGGEDPTLKAIEWLTPIGRGSRVTITGAARAGKTEALLRLAAALSGQDGLEVQLLLVGVRPEELSVDAITPTAALSVTASPDAQAQALERAVDTGKRVAARGGHAVLLVDSLVQVPETVARRALGAARALTGGGSLTVVATAPAELGGETTVIALDATLASTGRLPALDLVASGTLKPELLVGDAGAEAIAQARAAALDA